MNVVILAREARLQNASRGAKELFDIVNRECATAGEFRPRREGALAAQARQRGLACARLEGWGRLEPLHASNARTRVRGCARLPAMRASRGVTSGAGDFGGTNPSCTDATGARPNRRSTRRRAARALLFPVIYRGGLCCTRNGCGRYGSPAGYALIPNAAGSSTETPARVRCAACQRSRRWGRPRRSRRGP
jgi:hypothetical protein